MKKRLLALLLTALLCLSACGGAIADPVTGETPETNKTETLPVTEKKTEADPAKIYPDAPKITKTLTRAELDAIPVASAEMTEEELRKIVVDYMRLMTGVVWTPDESISYQYPSAYAADAAGDLHLLKGIRYGGVPYTQAAADLECFFDYYDEETGVVSISSVKSAISSKFGNNCGTAVFWAWQRVCGTIDYYGTRAMCKAHGCVPVGSWTYDESLKDFYDYTTEQVVKDNGEKVMYDSYACFKPGDGMTMLQKSGSGDRSGHARLVEEVHVERKSDGSVDPDRSYVYCLEQGSKGNNRETEDGVVSGISGYHRQYTFRKLYDTGYLPVTVPQLCGAAKVEAGEASFAPADDANPVKAFLNGTVTGNYCISRTTVTFTDAAGNAAYTGTQTGSCKPADQYTMQMSRAVSGGSLTRNLKKGETYNVTVTVRLGNGETLTAWEGTLLYQP